MLLHIPAAYGFPGDFEMSILGDILCGYIGSVAED